MGMLFTDQTRKISQLILISALVNIALNFLLIPRFGMMGAAIATVCGYLMMFLQGRIYCQRYYPIERNKLFEYTQMGLILLMLLAMTYLASTVESIYMLALLTFGLAFVFPVLNILLGFLTRKELGLLLELVRNARRSMGKSKEKRGCGRPLKNI